MALPGVFLPVEKDGRILIDGGAVNPLPYDLLEGCDLTVAVDVMGFMSDPDGESPSLFQAISGTFDIMQKSIIAEKLEHKPPDIYIKPEINNINILEFYKIDNICKQAKPAQDKLRTELEDFGGKNR
jgi:NTE family protein